MERNDEEFAGDPNIFYEKRNERRPMCFGRSMIFSARIIT